MLIKKGTEKISVPLVFRLGVHKEMKLDLGLLGDHRLSMAMDAINPIDYTVHGGLGAEYSWNNMLFARGGLNWGHDTKGLSLGAGAKWLGFGVDFDYVNYGDLVTLDGTESYDSNGSIIGYTWTQISGVSVNNSLITIHFKILQNRMISLRVKVVETF